MKKTLLGMALFTLTTPVWASLYVGIGGGPEWASFIQKSRVQSPSFDVINKVRLAGDGFFGSLFAGYGWNYKCFYLAGELNANISSVLYRTSNEEIKHNNLQGSIYKIPTSVGITLIPGFQMTDATLFYARLGYANGNFKVRATDTSLANIDTNLSGLHYGAGIKQGIYKQWSLLLEVSHISYQKKTLVAVDTVSTVTKRTHISPDTNQAKVGVVYNFQL